VTHSSTPPTCRRRRPPAGATPGAPRPAGDIGPGTQALALAARVIEADAKAEGVSS